MGSYCSGLRFARLSSGALTSVVPLNSLRSLRSLRSNSNGKLDHEARCARRLKFSAPRRCRNRPPRLQPAARAGRSGGSTWMNSRTVHNANGVFAVAVEYPGSEQPQHSSKGVSAQGGARVMRRRGSQSTWPRAQRASSTDSSRLSERSAPQGRGVSFATGHVIENRREVAKRPPHPRAPPCADTPLPPRTLNAKPTRNK